MSHEISYADMPRYLADDKAIEDIRSWCNDKVWAILREEADAVTTVSEWMALNRGMAFAGISGYPVHAFGRRYCFTAYTEWMRNGKDGVELDAHGFPIKPIDNGNQNG